MNIDMTNIGFFAIAEPHEYHVDYKVYECSKQPNGEILFYHPDGYLVESTNEAQVYLSGSVKWDGCSNWNFDIGNDCMIHFCTKQQMQNIGALLARLWDKTSELCPKWCSDVAE